jgi:hypothetical protein
MDNNHVTRREDRLLQQRWHGWASPIGLGVGLLCVGGSFWLLAVGLSVLLSIDWRERRSNFEHTPHSPISGSARRGCPRRPTPQFVRRINKEAP